jgi:hypothetical protein
MNNNTCKFADKFMIRKVRYFYDFSNNKMEKLWQSFISTFKMDKLKVLMSL